MAGTATDNGCLLCPMTMSSLFLTARRPMEFSDEDENLFGATSDGEASLRVLGSYEEQIAMFPRAAEGSPWHGYPVWAPSAEAPANRRKQKHRPPKEVFDQMIGAGLINQEMREALNERRPRMNRLSENSNGSIVPYVGFPCPDGFEVCWAGEFSVPDPSVPPLLCLGSIDGKLLFSDQDFTRLQPGKSNGSGEAINGVVRLGTWVGVSTRQEVSFWSTTKPQGMYLPRVAHGISATSSGFFVAPLGQAGILTAKPSENDVSLTAHSPGDGHLYVYRVLCLRSQTGAEILACAARRGGIVAGLFSASQQANPMERQIRQHRCDRPLPASSRDRLVSGGGTRPGRKPDIVSRCVARKENQDVQVSNRQRGGIPRSKSPRRVLMS